MRIAIVGTGISGLVAAHHLHREHDITLFEANDYIGGHTHTVPVDLDGRTYWIDTGYIVCNDWTYPNFLKLLADIGVKTRPTSMSFSVKCDRTGIEYNGTSLNGVFAQRLNLLRPSFLRMIRDILRFNRQALAALDRLGDAVTVDQFLDDGGYSKRFREHYLLPMGAAIWSCPTGTFGKFPMKFIVEFYKNHGLLSVSDRPTWHVIEGGSHSYVNVLIKPFRQRIRLNAPVRSIRRDVDEVTVLHSGGQLEKFDHVVLACHSDQALKMLERPTSNELDVLTAIPYEENSVVLHTDESVLPRNRRAWASWNYHVRSDDAAHATLTYNMNILQHIESKHTFCVSLNSDDVIDPGRVLRRFKYSHPVFTTARAAAQRRHAELLCDNRTSFCGAYWGNGFHEDGVNSALAVCDALQRLSARNTNREPATAR